MSDRGLTHLDPLGRALMVDVTRKEPSHRRAVARARVHMQSDTASLVARSGPRKGTHFTVAGFACSQAPTAISSLFLLRPQPLIGRSNLHDRCWHHRLSYGLLLGASVVL